MSDDETEPAELEVDPRIKRTTREYIASRVQAVATGAESRGMDGASMLIGLTAEAIANCSGRQFLDFAYEVRELWQKYAPQETKQVLPFTQVKREAKRE